MGLLDGQVAIVTGAGRGIGRSIAESLAEAGCRLALCSRTSTAEAAAAAVAAESSAVFGRATDVSRPEDFRQLVAEVLERYGQVDILVNNAAVNNSGAVVDMTQDSFDQIFATNVRGLFFAVQAVVPTMISRRHGKIINVASWVARTPVPLFTAYSASKAAVLSLTRGLALELAEHDINVNAVCPGNVWSDIWESSTVDLRRITGKTDREYFDEVVATHPLGRAQTGRDIGAATVFLCSEAARNITGEALFIAGGL